jgi:acetolactate synthase-1/2/3 large subunit
LATGSGSIMAERGPNGAKSLLSTLVGSGVEVCFTNPGTSEMHFVAALDEESGMRAVLGLFEGVVTGAADGYGRMAGKPACTLLHLGPGLANGLANLHNARRANTPIVNVVGEHATYHRALDAPLTSDIRGFASPVSSWIHVSESADQVAGDRTGARRARPRQCGRCDSRAPIRRALHAAAEWRGGLGSGAATGQPRGHALWR